MSNSDWWLDHQELTREEVQGYEVALAWRAILDLGLDAPAAVFTPQESAPPP